MSNKKMSELKSLSFSNVECSCLLKCLEKEINRLERKMDKGPIRTRDIDDHAKLCDLYNYICLSFGLGPMNCTGAFYDRAFKMLERNSF